MSGADRYCAIPARADVLPACNQSIGVVAGAEFDGIIRDLLGCGGTCIGKGVCANDLPVSHAVGVTGSTVPIGGAVEGIAALGIQPGDLQINIPAGGVAVAHVAGNIHHPAEQLFSIRARFVGGGIGGGIHVAAGDHLDELNGDAGVCPGLLNFEVAVGAFTDKVGPQTEGRDIIGIDLTWFVGAVVVGDPAWSRSGVAEGEGQ